MNHRTHSGNSSTVITNPNAFDSRSTKKLASSSSINTNQRLTIHSTKLTKNAMQNDRIHGTATTTATINCNASNHETITVDFDALESIPFDDDHTIVNDTNNGSVNNSTITIRSNNIKTINNENNAHISAVFKKLTTYFSNSSHKTLTNLKIDHKKSNDYNDNSKHNNKNNKCNNYVKTKPIKQLGDHKFSSYENNSIDNCAVFENCNAVPSSVVSSNGNDFRDDISSSTITATNINTMHLDKQMTNCVVTTMHTLTKPANHYHHSSDRHSSNSNSHLNDCSNNFNLNSLNASSTMYQNDTDQHSIDCMDATNSSSTSITRSMSNNRSNDLKTGETFSLPRVTLRQRYV